MTLFWDKQSSGLKFNLSTFRNTKEHNLFATWSPYQRGLLYYNFLINYYVNQNKSEFIKFKKTINNLNIGNPPHILFNEKFYISYDDCLSFEEIFFLKKKIQNKKKLKIIEIGPGYGRTVECILKNFNVSHYLLVDYKNILLHTKIYLKKVLDKKFYDKIIFCEFENFNFKKNFFEDNFNLKNFDLFINSDSFHEIEKSIIIKYLNFFSPICNKFFIKNAVAKYRPQDLINHQSKKDIPIYNKKLGLRSEIINIFDSKKIKFQSKMYLKDYNPFKYKKKTKVFSMLSKIYPTCMLALFVKNDD